DPAANERFALHTYGLAADLGLRPLLFESNGRGGFRVWNLFREALPGSVLVGFGNWVAHDHEEFGLGAVEVFPKQTTIPPGGWGSWRRLPGGHHARGVWPRVWTGSAWVEGQAAVDPVLSLTGDAPDLIPPDAMTCGLDLDPGPPPVEPEPRPPDADPGWLDPYEAFNRQTT